MNMKHHLPVIAFLVSIQPALGQGLLDNSSRLNVTGDAAVNVEPDRVRILLGVESRHKALLAAKAENDAATRKVIEAARAMNIAAGDIPTDYMQA